MINVINIGWKWLRVATTEEAETGRPRKKLCNVMLRLKSISPGGKPWLMLMDVLLNEFHPRLDCEGQRWKVIVPEKPTTLTKAHSGQETKALQPSPTSSVHGRRFLFRSQKRLQTKFGRGPHCSCKPIGQKPTTQIKHTPCVFLTPLISKNNVPLFLMLHPSLLKTFS